MNKKLLIGTLLVIIAVIIFLILVRQESPTITPGKPKALFGTSLTQKGPTAKWTDETLKDAFQKAKEGGFKLAIWTSDWGSVEPSLGNYEWAFLDYVTEKTKQQDFKFSLSLEIAQIADNPNYPKEINFTKFDEPDFLNRFKSFTRALVSRYKGKIDYLWIGQEVDVYLYNHPEQKEPMIKLFREFEKEAKSIDPAIKVGFVGAYHLAKEIGNIKVLQELAQEGDVVAFTVYPEENSDIRNPSQTQNYFEEMMTLFPTKKIAIHETAWSSGGPKGNKNKQAEYAKELSNIIDKHKDRFEFLSWYLLHDFSEEDNLAAAAEYGVEGSKELLDWHGSLGLLKNNGNEKAAWKTWENYMLSNAREK